MLIAIAVYALSIAIVVWIEHDLFHRLHRTPLQLWLIEHVFEPFLRLTTLIIFVLAAYPDIFALDRAPSLLSVLSSQPNWFTEMMNLLLVLTFFLPLLPVFGRLPALVLPVQAAAVAALLFHWTARAMGMTDYGIWPGWLPFAGLVFLAILGMAVARPLAITVARKLDREDWQDACTDLLVLVLQAPAVLVYTHALGKQVLT